MRNTFIAFALLIGTTSAFAQVGSLPVTSAVYDSEYTNEIFSFDEAKIVEQGVNAGGNSEWAVVQVGGLVEGNLGGAKDLMMIEKYEDAPSPDSASTIRLQGRRVADSQGVIRMGGACTTESLHSPFRLLLKFTNSYVHSIPVGQPKWTLKFADNDGIKGTVILQGMGQGVWKIETLK